MLKPSSMPSHNGTCTESVLSRILCGWSCLESCVLSTCAWHLVIREVQHVTHRAGLTKGGLEYRWDISMYIPSPVAVDDDQRKFSVRNFRVTDIQELFIHHSSIHHSSIHHSSYTTHHTPLIIHHSSIHHSSNTTHHAPLIIHHSSTTHPPLIIHHSSNTTHHIMLCFSIERVGPKLASQALQNDVCETVSGHAHGRIMLGIVPPLWLEVSLVS